MSGINLRSTRQGAKPLIINLKKTEVGYMLVDGNEGNIISLSKAVIKQERNPSQIKEVPKPVENKPPPVTAGQLPGTTLTRSKTQPKLPPPILKSPNVNVNPMKEKAPILRSEMETRKRDIYPFAGYNDNGPSNLYDGNAPNDYKDFISSEIDKAEKANDNAITEQEISKFKTVDKITKKYPVIIPSSAHWFKFDEIHQIEKESIPEFFTGKPSKTPEIYKRYRNFIINLYRQNPRTYLNSTTCRRNLAGDVCAIMRIHSFLEHWGLINFNVDPTTHTQNLFLHKPNYTSEKIFKFSKRDDKLDLFDLEKKGIPKSNENDLLFHQIKLMTKNARPLCDFCGMICGMIWYQQKSPQQYQNQANTNDPSQPSSTPQGRPGSPSQQNQTQQGQPTTPKGSSKGTELVLCLKCYNDGNIPNILSSNDFFRVDLLSKGAQVSSGKPLTLSSWNQEDTLKLLEFIQKFGDNWTDVQKYFPNKTKEEIILHYLQLPVKSVTAINIIDIGEDRAEELTPPEKIAENPPTVFSDYSNPILQHVAIFKSLLDKHKGQKEIPKPAEKIKEEPLKNEAEQNENKNEIQIEEVQEKKNGEVETKQEIKEEEQGAGGEIKEEKEKEREVINLAEKNKERELQQQRFDKVYELNQTEGEYLLKIEKETTDKAGALKRREEDKIKEIANLLVDMQINKLEAKITYLEEYERILWQERKQQEIFQKALIAERVALAQKRLEIEKLNSHGMLTEGKDVLQNLGQGQNINIDDMFSLGNNDKMEEFPKNEHF